MIIFFICKLVLFSLEIFFLRIDLNCVQIDQLSYYVFITEIVECKS